MRFRFTHLLALLLVSLPYVGSTQAPEPQPVTLEAIWAQYSFYPQPGVSYQWLSDDNYYTELKNSYLIKKAVTLRLAPDTLLRPADLTPAGQEQPLNIQEYRFTEAEDHVVFLTNYEQIYRHSYTAKAWVYDFTREQLVQLANGEAISYPTFSPDGRYVAYVRANNLFYQDLASLDITAVTQDGVPNRVINGSTDWVHEEEFAFWKAFFWSPDSKRLAFYRFDESNVPQVSMPMYRTLYPDLYTFKYPKAGEDNAIVTLHLYSLDKGITKRIDVPSGQEVYYPRMKWVERTGELAVLKTNRHQTQLDLLLVNPNTAKPRTILTETSEVWLTEPSDEKVIFLTESNGFIYQSDRDGWNQLFYYDLDGKLKAKLTPGPYEVTEVYGVDEKNGRVYYQSTQGRSEAGDAVNVPHQRQLYHVDLKGKKQTALTTLPGWHDAEFSSHFRFAIETHSQMMQPPITQLLNASNGKAINTLVANEGISKRLANFELQPAEFMTIPNEAGQDMAAYRILPKDYDASQAYPVLMYTYNGPGHQEVVDRYDPFNFFWFQHLAHQGIMVVCVDGRGTGGKGRDFQKATYKNLGHYETQDMIAAAKWLGKQPDVDADRIGIWGWSYGGYLSSLCITKGAGVFSLAIAVAPVTNWRFYDTIYTERFLQTPQENAEGYDENSPINFVQELKGDYLLIHGTADDNVHFQNSMEMVNALVQANKPHDAYFYPNRNHGIYGGTTRLHLYHKMTRFLQERL